MVAPMFVEMNKEPNKNKNKKKTEEEEEDEEEEVKEESYSFWSLGSNVVFIKPYLFLIAFFKSFMLICGTYISNGHVIGVHCCRHCQPLCFLKSFAFVVVLEGGRCTSWNYLYLNNPLKTRRLSYPPRHGATTEKFLEVRKAVSKAVAVKREKLLLPPQLPQNQVQAEAQPGEAERPAERKNPHSSSSYCHHHCQVSSLG